MYFMVFYSTLSGNFACIPFTHGPVCSVFDIQFIELKTYFLVRCGIADSLTNLDDCFAPGRLLCSRTCHQDPCFSYVFIAHFQLAEDVSVSKFLPFK